MDDPAADRVRLDRTYAQFDRVNRLVSGWRGLYRTWIRPALIGGARSLVDVGCGGGDILRHLARWASTDGLALDLTGIDPDPRALHFARQHAPSASPIAYRQTTLEALATDAHEFDIVISNHVLHHLSDDAVQDFLAASRRVARLQALHADLHRSPFAARAFGLLAPVFPSSFIVDDGRISLRRAFTSEELRALAPAGWHVETRFPARLVVRWSA